MIRHLAYAILYDIARINRFIPFISGICQSIGNKAGILHAFQLINQFQDSGRQVNTVRNHFHSHSIRQIHTFHCTLIFIFTTFMETRHRIIEMSSMRKSYCKCSFNFIIFGFGMCNSSHNSFRTGILCKIMCTGQFGTNIPTSDTRRMLQQRNIFIFIRSFQKTVILRTRHLRIQIWAFDMQTENRRILLFHQVLTYIDCLVDSFE